MYDAIWLSYRTLGGDLVYPSGVEINRIMKKHRAFIKAQFNKNQKRAMNPIKPIKKEEN